MKELQMHIDRLINGDGILATFYKYVMLAAIIVSIIPLMFVNYN